MKETHILKHKNIDVAKICLIGGFITNIIKIDEKEHLPFLMEENMDKNIVLINNWLGSRGIPFSREDYELIMEKYKVENSRELVLLGMGLNLTDHYWIKDIKDERKWENVNFFDNDFSLGIGELIPELQEKYQELMNPDFSSNGRLKKMWIIENGKRILYKSGSGDIRQEPYNENIASELCKKLGISNVEYKVGEYNNDIFSKCECMINKNTEFINSFIVYLHGKKTGDRYEDYINICINKGIKNTREELEKMLVLDYLIRNTDRNPGNYGIVRNPETLEWESLNKLFDNGNSLWYNVSVINNIGIEKRSNCRSFLGENEKNIKLVKNYNFDKKLLNNFNEVIEYILKHTGMEKERLKNIGKSFMKRVNELEIILNKNNNQNINNNSKSGRK